MNIAVTYENGEIFQHFGHTEQFKLYETENGHIMRSEVFGSNGTGHEALAGLLADRSIQVLICGGLGQGAMNALTEMGIEVVAGVRGDADEAVERYLAGELKSTGVNCDHHHEEHKEGGCGHCGSEHEEGSCGGCSGGCHVPAIEGKNVGRTCRVHYTGTLNDGSKFDSSYDRGEPLEFICGAGQMIRGFDAAVANMDPGQILDVHLMPEEAYGIADPRAIFTIEFSHLPGSEALNVGEQVYLSGLAPQPVPVTVAGKSDTTITFDANHELAGKELNFRIELVEVK